MKANRNILLLIAGLLAIAQPGHATTNDLAVALQKGLFEEEANGNLSAAIQAYQSVASQFDKDRRLAATAIFRLGECYRKQGNTNEANLQYERVLREFSDQTQLATLSRNWLGIAGGGKPGEPARALPSTSAETEEVKRIREMIKNSPDLINAPVDGNTPLQAAAQRGQLVVAQFLLESGADVNAKNVGGNTALHLAANSGHKAMVELLLGHGGDVNARANNGQTPLHQAAGRGFRTVAEALLAHQANVNARDDQQETPLHKAAAAGQLSLVQLLVSAYADVNARNEGKDQPLSPPFFGGQKAGNATPLVQAILGKHSPVVQFLLTNKAEVNLECFLYSGSWVTRTTPLQIAIVCRAFDMLELLLKAGADPNTPEDGKAGHTALRRAVQEGLGDVTALLLAYHADANVSDENGWTPLCFAAKSQSPAMVQMLLTNRADVDHQTSEKQTPLHLAALRGSEEVVKLLLAAGANPNLPEQSGDTPLHYAVRTSRKDLVELLLAKGADVNLANRQGRTPLALAEASPSQPGMSYGMPMMSPPPPGAPVPSLPGRTLRLPGTAVPAEPAKPAEVAELLRQHGAVAQLPDFSVIRVTRQRVSPMVTFSADTNGVNHFSLMEALVNFYNRGNFSSYNGPLPWPDFGRIQIHRPDRSDPAKEKLIPVNLLNGTNGLDCSKDLVLEIGDLVEIPEREHTLAEPAVGLTQRESEQLQSCVVRKVKFVVKGVPTEVTLSGYQYDTYLALALRTPKVQAILRSSSDLSRVRVKRGEPAKEWVFDAQTNPQGSIQPNDIWLRDGDVVEVPDKS